MNGTIIQSVDPNGCMHGKAQPGERLVSINGNPIEDVLDYRYWSYDARLTVELATPCGAVRQVHVRKRAGEDLGLEFSSTLMDELRPCRNRCVFCFVDQMPRGMRRSLYFKDDDARLSFLTGSYITLTNLSDREIDRICALHISPIRVSVHATDPELRARLLGNPDAAQLMPRLRRLAEAGIHMDCQIVCCPGLNDGEALTETMHDLACLYPQVSSVAVVPVGLTRYRERLYPLTPFDRDSARETIERVTAFGSACLSALGSRIVFCSDEFYIKAELPLPDDEAYEDYAQLENGVGMLRLLETEFLAALKTAEPEENEGRPFSIATGVSAAPFLEKLMLTAAEKCGTIQGTVYPIVNNFFGPLINVAGLITGGDLIDQLRGKPLGERLLIPTVMLRRGENVFLDDVTLDDVIEALGVPVIPLEIDGGVLLDHMLRADP